MISRQPHLADQMAGDMERLMKVIRLHSGQGNNPTGVLDENQARLNQIGKKFKHLGNSLLVSSNAEHLGSRLNGWRLVAPPGHEGSSFLSYLDNHGKTLLTMMVCLTLNASSWKKWCYNLMTTLFTIDEVALSNINLHAVHTGLQATLAADEEEE